MSQVIVVGGGLTGLSAAHTVLERGGNVVVIDKMAFFGGNSTKGMSDIHILAFSQETECAPIWDLFCSVLGAIC
jgi:succinate dehydrogenase/fumarate reductase flavoprotein subunit